MDDLHLNENYTTEVFRYDTVVVGSGAAGFAAVNELHRAGRTSFCLVTEGVNMGTSRNTGSDKQTYYKLSVAGEQPDSVRQMARDLFAGGCIHGDTAMVQAALSARVFFNLVNLGVPFPSNECGEYVGYKTDHDNSLRAVSAGPLTSKYMVECLEKEARKNGVTVYDHRLAADILVDDGRVTGLLALNTESGKESPVVLSVFLCNHLVLAVGGPAGLYRDSVYPPSQTGGSGLAYRAGAKGANLTEWQYGIASKAFRWNLSGSYQQVLPRYIAVGEDGHPREFLRDTMDDRDVLAMIFLKGYQWPFDAAKALNNGSSRVDLAVYEQTLAGNRVFLDFTQNPLGDDFDFSLLTDECRQYLQASDALLASPADRLKKLNPKAYDLYLRNGYDLYTQPLEICVAAQHNNGGIAVDADCRTTVAGLYAIGEAAATFGVYRPGGTALNATQTDAIRAAQSICKSPEQSPSDTEYSAASDAFIGLCERYLQSAEDPAVFRGNLRSRMSDRAAFVRDSAHLEAAIDECRRELDNFGSCGAGVPAEQLPDVLRNRDLILTQYVCLCAMLDYARHGGSSRGSFLVREHGETIQGDEKPLFGVVQYTAFDGADCRFEWQPVRDIPNPETWFENLLRNK